MDRYGPQLPLYSTLEILSTSNICVVAGGIGVVLRQDPAATAQGYLGPCLAEGLARIPEDRRSHSPVFLAATAGMRLVQ